MRHFNDQTRIWQHGTLSLLYIICTFETFKMFVLTLHVKVAATCYKKNLTKILQWGKVKVCLNFNVYLHYISYVIRREGRYITCLFALCYPCDVYSADVCFCETVDIKSSAILSIKLVKVFHYNFQKLMCYVHRKMFSCSN